MPIHPLSFELLVGGSGLLVLMALIYLSIAAIRNQQVRQPLASAAHCQHKRAPEYGSEDEQRYHRQLLKEFDGPACDYLEAIYTQRQIYGEQWVFYRRPLTTLCLSMVMLGFLVLFGVLCWGWVQDDLMGSARHLPHFPAWLEHLSEFSLWLAGSRLAAASCPY